MDDTININRPKKDYCAPMHTAEHILNQTMVRTFGCRRSQNAHIERKKSKCDYIMREEPTAGQLAEVEKMVNDIIDGQLSVTIDYVSKEEAGEFVDLSKLPPDAADTIRIVRIGDYDACACIGEHVRNTSEIGRFKLLNCDYENGRLRIRFKVEEQSL
jgi:Ser-tRNA(Ala) deacylase AlaX